MQSWVNTLTPAVGESVVLTVRLFSIGNLRHVALHRPDLKNGTLEELQGPITGLQVVNGRPLVTNDFQYLLVPQQDGPLTVPPFKLKLTAANESLWRTAAIKPGLEIASDELNLTVHPVADEARQDLPATSLKISARIIDPWQAENAEPVSYQVSTVARGADGDRIPAFSLPRQTADFTITRTESSTETRVLPNGYGIEGTRIDTFLLTPTRQGELSIPGVEVTWWNTALEEEESTLLPETRVQFGKPQETGAAADEDSFSPLSDRIQSDHAFQHFLMPLSLGLILAIMIGVWICGPGLHRAD